MFKLFLKLGGFSGLNVDFEGKHLKMKYTLPCERAAEALFNLSFSLSRPMDLLLARASPFCMVECHECGRDFLVGCRPRVSFTLLLPPPLPPPRVKKAVIDVSDSAGLGMFSLRTPYCELRLNISMARLVVLSAAGLTQVCCYFP